MIIKFINNIESKVLELVNIGDIDFVEWLYYYGILKMFDWVCWDLFNI